MARERIFQGRQRGILELAHGKSHLYAQSRQSSYQDPAFRKTLPTAAFHFAPYAILTLANTDPIYPSSSPSGSESPVLNNPHPPTSKREQPRLDKTPQIGPRKGAPSPLPAPGEACPPQFPFLEKAGLNRAFSGCRWEASPRASRAAGSAGHLSYRCGPRLPARADPVRLRYGLQRRCALVGGADALPARAPVRSSWVSPRWRWLLCQECESFRFPLGIKANHK